jgi:hypothetical protein
MHLSRTCLAPLVIPTALAVVLAAAPARASDSPEAARIQKRISAAEKTLDHVLLDSPNFLVQRGRNAHGLYVPDFGAILTFNAQVNADDSIVEVFGDDEHSRVIVRHDRGHRHHGPPAVMRVFGISVNRGDHGDEGDDPVSLYQEGKAELVEMILDQAGTLGALPAGQWIVVSGCIDDDTLRDEKQISRLVLRVRTDDLRAYADGKLDDAAAAQKILIEES